MRNEAKSKGGYTDPYVVFKPTARWEYWSQPREMRLASEKERPLVMQAGIGG